MSLGKSSCRGRRRRSSHVLYLSPGRSQHLVCSRTRGYLIGTGLNKGPGAHVEVLLLAPNDSGVFVFAELFLERHDGERSDLLDADNCNIVLLEVLARLSQVIVNLSRAEDHLLDGLWLAQGCLGFWDDHSKSFVFAELVYV